MKRVRQKRKRIFDMVGKRIEQTGCSSARYIEYENQIDQLVYQLFDLSDDEIIIVEARQNEY